MGGVYMTEELLKKLKEAKTVEEKKELIKAYKSELSDEDLSQVTGGTIITDGRACW